MYKFIWLFNRLKTMNIMEIIWRIKSKIYQKYEYYSIYKKNIAIIDYKNRKMNINININKLCINKNNSVYSLSNNFTILNEYSYQKYKKCWNYGFQTKNYWPSDVFSYKIPISQRNDIGDIRTNWELNRHYQFALLAKNYYITSNKKYFDENYQLFYDWNKNNLFLHGVEWVSPMEIAIRVNSWIYTYYFISISTHKINNKHKTKLLNDLENGIINMVEYIIKHRSKYSSANNHLIVEMYAVAIASIIFENKKWEKISFKVLTKELIKQNYKDGVNKEMSLHYQAFIMECYGLLMCNLNYNNKKIPDAWIMYLEKMSEFLYDSHGKYGETIEFGDDDEGKILDLSGNNSDYYKYILDLMSLVLPKRYADLNNVNETLNWIFEDNIIKKSKHKTKCIHTNYKCYNEGGYTFIRSCDNNVLIGIDHGALGFKPICAHGHADGLSLQLYAYGIPVLVDPGTYNYHISKKYRNDLRSTKFHNTILVSNINQSSILGPFLSRGKFHCTYEKLEDDNDVISVKFELKYKSITHRRIVKFNIKTKELVVNDIIPNSNNKKIVQIWNINPTFKKNKSEKEYILKYNGIDVSILNDKDKSKVEKSLYSPKYNEIIDSYSIQYITNNTEITTIIKVGDK